jgi:ubiquinone/menaquinone biosynthesis C-methylase UbiE
MTYAPKQLWNAVFSNLKARGDDLDWSTQWTPAFLESLEQYGVRRILELGCGTGNDAIRLAQSGFKVTALDYSDEAITQARSKSSEVRFMVADIAQRLPFVDGQFDALISNVALHMFSDVITRQIFSEVARVTKPEGLFMFHVNALEDMPLRQVNHPRKRQLEENYFEEEDGQTMHFFSREYITELLGQWRELSLALIEIQHHHTGEPFKRVWRGVYQRV